MHGGILYADMQYSLERYTACIEGNSQKGTGEQGRFVQDKNSGAEKRKRTFRLKMQGKFQKPAEKNGRQGIEKYTAKKPAEKIQWFSTKSKFSTVENF